MNTNFFRFSLLFIGLFLCEALLGIGLDSEETVNNKILRIKINLSDDEGYRKSELENYNQIRMEGMPEGLYDLVVSEEEYSELLSQGFDIQIISTDHKQSMSVLSDIFYTNDSAYAFIDSLQQNYPDIVKVDSIGMTHEARTIWCVKLSEDVEIDDPDKPGIFYSGCIHANELAGTNVVLSLMDTIVSGYNLGVQDMIDILHDHQIWIVPILNPDGVAYVHEHQDLTWRKNRRDNGDGSFGVDINRNFAYKWGYDDEGSSPVPSDKYSYRGPSPFSEPESQAIRNFFTGPGSENRHFVTLITYHMKYAAGAFLYPWYYVDDYTEHHSVYSKIGEDFTTITKTEHGNAKDMVGYVANGSLDEWVYATSSFNSTTMASTVEIGRAGLMPDYPIDLLLSTHIPANLQLIKNTQDYMDSVSVIDDEIPVTITTCDWVTGNGDTLIYGADSLIRIELITDINHPEFMSDIITEGNPDDIKYNHSKLYTIYTTILGDPYWCKVIDSMGVYDISDPYHPAKVKIYRLPGHIYDVQFSDEYLVFLDSTGMKIMRETETYQLVEVGQYDTPVKPSCMAIDGQTVCIANNTVDEGEPIFIVNISGPSSPQLLGQPYSIIDSIGIGLEQLYLKENLLFVIGDTGAGYLKIAVLDISNPDSISINSTLGGELLGPQFYNGPISFYQNAAIVPTYDEYFIYNCDDPATIDLPADATLEFPYEWQTVRKHHPVFLNNHGFVATGENGLFAFDATDPFNPFWLYKVGLKEQEIIIPLTSHLNQNFPNPFNPTTTIRYQLSTDSQVELTIYDLAGREVATLIDDYQLTGYHSVNWNATFFPSGIYLYRLITDDFVETKKMVLMK
jgi:hypothetical protein